MTEPVADPAIMAISVVSLGYAAKRAGSVKPRHRPPASNQRCSDGDMDSPRLQLLEVSDWRQTKCVRFELNVLSDPAVMSGLAWRVRLLSKQHNSTDRRLSSTTKLNVRCDLAKSPATVHVERSHKANALHWLLIACR